MHLGIGISYNTNDTSFNIIDNKALLCSTTSRDGWFNVLFVMLPP